MSPRCPKWIPLILVCAGLYNLIVGLSLIITPNLAFNLFELTPPRYPAYFQTLGAILAVLALGYLLAATDPTKHWSLILIGLLTKLIAPLFIIAAAIVNHDFPHQLAYTTIPNDILWWIPLAAALYGALKLAHLDPTYDTLPIQDPSTAMRAAEDQFGLSIHERSESTPTLVVFLRHFGCTFCRETLRDLEQQQHNLRQRDIDLVIVHMSDDAHARRTLLRYGLEHVARISDPDQSLYRSFDLHRGSPLQLFGPRAIRRAIHATLSGNLQGRSQGDAFQMPGVFLVEHGHILHALRHHHAGQRPNYVQLALEALEPTDLETFAKQSVPA